jgi:hypothetical protein
MFADYPQLAQRPVHHRRRGRERHGAVDKIKRGAGGNGEVSNPDKIISAKVSD